MENINLGEEYQHYVQKLIDSGEYENVDDVMRQALQALKDHEASKLWKEAALAKIEESEKDFEAGRSFDYTPGLLLEWTKEFMNERKEKPSED
jgi:putative addiction module CopG family antidote